MSHDPGAVAVHVAAEALRTACLASAATPAAGVLHQTYDRVLAEPVPGDMRAMTQRIDRRRGA